MTESELIRRQRELLHGLVRLAADRARAEANTATAFAARTQAANEQLEATRQEAASRFGTDLNATQQDYELMRQRVAARFQSETRAAEHEGDDARDKAAAIHEMEKDKCLRELQEVRWESAALLDAAKNGAQLQFKEIKNAIDAGVARCTATENEAIRLLDEWRQHFEFTPVTPDEVPQGTPAELQKRFNETLEKAEAQLKQLQALVIPKVFQGHRLRWAAGVFWAVSVLSLYFTSQRPFTLTPFNLTLIILSVIGPVLISFAVRAVLAAVSKAQIAAVCQPMVQAVTDCEAISERWRQAATLDLERQKLEVQRRHDRDVREAETRANRLKGEAKVRYDAALAQLNQTYPALLREIAEHRDRELLSADAKFPPLLVEIRQRFDRETNEATQRHQRTVASSVATRDAEYKELSEAWSQGLTRLLSEEREIDRACRDLFPNWHNTSAAAWKEASAVPPAIRCGEYLVRMAQIPHMVPADEKLRAAVPESFSLPALLPFPAGCSTLLKATDAGRDRAVDALQALMLRFLTSVPPGKVRFTIIDPVGLGENFAAFMHLADFDEALVNSRIWTEPQHIDQRLSDLTEHMENVIQKYLRNEYETIEKYNADAGEVAEPFRIVVVANFPANFTESSARRLVSIASSGARCGVYTLVSVDTRLPMPHGFNLADLEQHAVCFRWDRNRFVWEDPDFAGFELTFDVPPPAGTFTDLLQRVGERAKEASRVEVPFEFVAPEASKYWLGDSRPGLNVPLGRSGATKTQNLRLGQGTSQHALIAGKTGSGKSTLLHVLITNVSLLYSPDEVQLYLVDFKKGVEFKTYATYELPHARVVAIESEREFGLSVLQRLDNELKRRGDLFRQAGVQDLSGYRQLNGGGPMPRILLVVDEFQEFFVEDDRIAQECSLLLDRLVRQGRAFGIHVQLGSQTLGGAYSLARSTLGQMAVRIALQCSESDAHLILSDDNTAARLLSRPGEAIYNDANGLIEGNNFFQIVWLSDERREEYLRRIRDLANKRNYLPANPQIVFEGNVPSDIRKNHLLRHAIAAPRWPSTVKSPTAWLGEAVAIKDPTGAVFRSQVGSNLLMIGQQDESALSIVLSTIVSIAAQQAPSDEQGPPFGARFYVLDGSSSDAPHSGVFDKLCNVLPHSIHIAGPRELGPVITTLSETVDRRQKSNVADEPSIYLIVFDLQRFRELRRQEDDFGFSRRGEDKPVSPSKHFATVLREGPSCRVHTIVWCDSLNNLNRTLERQMIREFDMRVLFQMSAGDSSTIIDSPAASKLGVNRAIYHSEEDAIVEKFRPYGLPTDDWLATVRDQLNARPVHSQPLPVRSQNQS
jgi:hypothetical protein